MDESAPKRRKISPTTHVASSDSAAPPSSPTRPARPSRPSFSSPTKASLSRANPDVLARRNTQQSQSQPQQSQSQWQSQSGAMMRERPHRASTGPSPGAEEGEGEGEGEADPFRDRDQVRRSPAFGARQEEEQPREESEARSLGSDEPGSSSASPIVIPDEPPLAATRHPRRSRGLAEMLRRSSSPVKKPSSQDEARATATAQSQRKPDPGPTKPAAMKKPGPSKETSATKLPVRQQNRIEPPPGHLGLGQLQLHRNVQVYDPLAEKKALKAALLAEIAQLEADLKVTRKENDRLHELQDPATSATSISVSIPSDPENSNALFDLFVRHVLPAEKDPPSTTKTPNWLDTALHTCSFLPFNDPTSFAALMTSQPSRDSPDQPAPDPLPLPSSHHPISQTAIQELPYLQLFTPLTFTSTTTLLPHDAADNENQDSAVQRQRHRILVHSSPPGLFVAELEMLVNTTTLSISSLSVPRLDPSATPELAPFIGRQGRNVTVVAWAMAEWTRLAVRRARFWCAVLRDLGRGRDGVVKCVRSLRKRKKRRRRRRGTRAQQQQHQEESDGEGDEEESGEAEGDIRGRRDREGEATWSKAQILARMGQQALDVDLSRPGEEAGRDRVGVRVRWEIGFDGTGEGRSEVGVLVQAPGKWHDRDQRRSIAAIPALFDKLLRNEGGEPMRPLLTVVALLVGDGEK